MKALKTSLPIVMVFTFISLCMAQSGQEKQGPSFEQYLGQTMGKIQTQTNPSEILESVNQLKRISALFPEEWLADYYVALFDLKQSFGSPIENAQPLLDESINLINKLKEKSNMSSEIYTLEGYYYYALIAQNPKSNGVLYYKDVIGSYQKAINIDNKNPRPALLLIVFQNSMSKFMNQTNENICEDLAKVEQLFVNQKLKSPLDPSWGMSEFNKAKVTYCSSSSIE